MFFGLISCATADINAPLPIGYPEDPPPRYGVAYEAKWLGVELLLEDCRLLNQAKDGKTTLLYHFKGEKECHFMKGRKKDVRKFTTYDGRNIIPIGLSSEATAEKDCTTKGVAILIKEQQVFISKEYFLREDCKGFYWQEKPFHVLTIPENMYLLPSDIVLREE